jgi:hypothetical protein
MYIYTTCVRYNRSRDGQGGKRSRNRRYATTGPPQTLRRQAQRLSRFGGRVLRSGLPDADDEDGVVVGGVVGGRLKVTCRSRPAVLAVARGQVAPAQRGDTCPAAWLAPYLLVSGPLSGRVWTPCRFSPPSLGERNVLTAPALCKGRCRSRTAAAAHRPGGPERSGPAAAPPEV